MKKLISILFTFILLTNCISAYATTPAAYDFKQFSWGDSMEAVIAIEGAPEFEGTMNGIKANYIAYSTTAVGLDVLLAYYFCDDGLYEVRYILDEEHSNESLYIDDYNTFKAALTKKYGKPLWDHEFWENDSKKEFYADRKGDALCYGYLTYYTWYLTDRSCIFMDMSADNYDISMIVRYESKSISPGEADYSSEI